jgi:uncharacterized protein
VPGSHLVTINHLQQTAMASVWAPRIQNAWWASSVLMDPLRNGAKFLASKVGVSTPLARFQDNLVGMFYALFVQRVGFYLIELYSGRLKAGTEKYRAVMQPETEAQATESSTLKFGVVGPAGSGRRSLVRALSGCDDLPPDWQGHVPLELPDHSTVVNFHLVSVGENEEDPNETHDQLRHFDGLVWLLPAVSPPTQNIEAWKHYRSFYQQRPDAKMPPVIFAVNKIDLLPGVVEMPLADDRLEEVLHRATEQLGEEAGMIVPVCLKPTALWNVQESLLTAIEMNIESAKSVERVRQLKVEGESKGLGTVANQVKSGARGLWRAWKERRSQSKSPDR